MARTPFFRVATEGATVDGRKIERIQLQQIAANYDPATFPERPITLEGFKAEIDAGKWIVAECTHSMDGSGGLQSSLVLEGGG